MKTSFTLEEVLHQSGFRLPLKKTYTLREFLSMKRYLGAPPGPMEGALMVYDPVNKQIDDWLNERLEKHNMYYTGRGIVRLDDSKPLPPDYFTIGETLVTNIPSELFD